jgi:capsular polysaccharide transport system permease protein
MSDAVDPNHALTSAEMLRAQGRIIVALMLHDIRSRFGGSAFGFFAMGVGWPLSHILLLILVNSALGRTAPYGDSVALWYAVGVVPFLAFQYMSRFMSLGVVLNRPLLAFPVVRITDILFSRALVEVLNAGLVTIIVILILWYFGIDFTPRDPVQASLALLAMMLLGLGFGVLNAIIAAVFPFWVTGFALCTIVFWFSSGIFFVPDAFPEAVRRPLSYLPWLQGVEWMRSAYYDGYGNGILDRIYLTAFGAITLCVGLIVERLVRGKMKQW